MPIKPYLSPAAEQPQPTTASTVPASEEKGYISSFLDWFNKPLVNQSETTRAAVQSLAQPELDEVGPDGSLSLGGYAKAFLGGALEGASKPSTIVSAASLGLGGTPAALANVPFAIEGAHTAMDPTKSTAERVMGGVQAGTSALSGGLSAKLGKADLSPIQVLRQARATSGPTTLGLSGANQMAEAAKVPTPAASAIDTPAPLIQRELRNSPAMPDLESTQYVKSARKTEGQLGKEFAVDRAKRGAPLTSAEHGYLRGEIDASPKGKVAEELFGVHGAPQRSPVQEAEEFYAAREAAEGLRRKSSNETGRVATARQRELDRQAAQEAKNLNAREKFLQKQTEQEAKNLNARDKFTAKEAAQEAKNLNKREDFLGTQDEEVGKFAADARKTFEKGAAQEAKNLNAQESYFAKISAEIDKAIEARLAEEEVARASEGLVQGPTTVTRKVTAKTSDGGTETAVTRFAPEKPAGGGGATGGGDPTKSTGEVTPGGKIIMDVEELFGKAPETPPSSHSVIPFVSKQKAERRLSAGSAPEGVDERRGSELYRQMKADLDSKTAASETALKNELALKKVPTEDLEPGSGYLGAADEAGPSGPQVGPRTPEVPTGRGDIETPVDTGKQFGPKRQVGRPTGYRKLGPNETGQMHGPEINPVDLDVQHGPRYPEENIVGPHGPEEGPAGGPSAGPRFPLPSNIQELLDKQSDEALIALARAEPDDPNLPDVIKLRGQNVSKAPTMHLGYKLEDKVLENGVPTWVMRRAGTSTEVPVDTGMVHGPKDMTATKQPVAPIAPTKAKGQKTAEVDTGIQHGPEMRPVRGVRYGKNEIAPVNTGKQHGPKISKKQRADVDALSAEVRKIREAAPTPTHADAEAIPTEAPAQAPATAAKKVNNQLAKVVNLSGTKNAKEVQERVLDTLRGELAEAEALGAKEIVFRAGKAYGGREGTVYFGDEPIAHIDRYGNVRAAYGIDEGIASSLPKHLTNVRDITPGQMAKEAVGQLSQALYGTKNKRVTIEIPGDGTFTIDKQPTSLKNVIRRVEKGGNAPWSDLSEFKGGRLRSEQTQTPFQKRMAKADAEARRTGNPPEWKYTKLQGGEPPKVDPDVPQLGSPRWQEAEAAKGREAAKRVEEVLPSKKVGSYTEPKTAHGITEELLKLTDNTEAQETASKLYSGSISPNEGLDVLRRLRSKKGEGPVNAPPVTPIKPQGAAKTEFSPKLQEEIDYRLGLMEESAAEDGVPFIRDDAAIYQAIRDMEDSDAGLGPFKNELIDWQIKRGVYREMSPEEIANTTVIGGKGQPRKPWDLQYKGKKWKFEKGIEGEVAPTPEAPVQTGKPAESFVPLTDLRKSKADVLGGHYRNVRDLSRAETGSLSKKADITAELTPTPLKQGARIAGKGLAEVGQAEADAKQIAAIKQDLADPNVPEAMKAVLRDTLKKLGGDYPGAADEVYPKGSELAKAQKEADSWEKEFIKLSDRLDRAQANPKGDRTYSTSDLRSMVNTAMNRASEAKARLQKLQEGLSTSRDPERGALELEQAVKLGSTGAGALAGGAVGAEQTEEGEDPTANAILGAILGGAAGYTGGKVATEGALETAASIRDGIKKVVQLYPDIARGNLLFNMPNLIINAVVGPYGSAIMGSLEHAIGGDKRGLDALMKLANPLNFAKGFGKGYSEAGELAAQAAGRGEMSDAMREAPKLARQIIGGPGQAMTAGDISARDILMSAGFTFEEAKAITLTDEPSMPWSQAIMGLKRGPGAKSWAINVGFPFVRTVLNQAEGSLERTPLAGLLAQQIEGATPSPRNLQIAQQVLGTGALGGSFVLGMMMPPDPILTPVISKTLSNMGGQYGMVMLSAFLAGQAMEAGDENALKKFADSFMHGVPLPSTQQFTDMTDAGAKLMEGEFDPSTDIPRSVWPQALRPETTEMIGGMVGSAVGMEEEDEYDPTRLY